MIGLVLGGAAGLYLDMEALAAIAPYVPWGPEVPAPGFECAVLDANDAIAAYAGPLGHAISLHPWKLQGWLKARASQWPFFDRPLRWTHSEGEEGADRKLEIRRKRSGSSGLFAVQVAQHLGCERIVLCGVPMDGGPHFRGPPAEWEAWRRDFAGYREAWRDWSEHGELENVRSMSGWTRELCGAPDRAWLEGAIVCRST